MSSSASEAGLLRRCLPFLMIVALVALVPLAPGVRAEDEPATGTETPSGEEAPEPAEEIEEVPEEEAKAELPWVKDVAAAKAQAKAEGKDLFINFTGSDWCGWCKRLDAEVFEHAAFVDEATNDFVFLFLDFPRDPALKAEVVDPELNEELKEAYNVAGFPTIMITTAEGQPYARTGYQRGGPEAYLEHLTELREDGQVVKTLLADETHEDTEALVAAFPVLAEQGLLAYPDYEWTLAAAEAADPEGELGLLPLVEEERTRRLAAAEEKALRELMPAQGEEPDREAIKDFVLNSKHLSGPSLLNHSFGLADWLLSEGRPEEAQRLLDRAAQDPLCEEHEQAKQVLKQFRDRAQTMIEEQAAEDAGESEEGGEGSDEEDATPDEEGAGEGE